jgi:hypothetical protein
MIKGRGYDRMNEQRADALLRDLVSECQALLGPYGFKLAGRGGAAEHKWVRLSRQGRDPNGQPGTVQVLVAHAPAQHAVVVDVYFVDASLETQTPRRRLLHRYEAESELARVVQEVAATVRGWQGGSSGSGKPR